MVVGMLQWSTAKRLRTLLLAVTCCSLLLVFLLSSNLLAWEDEGHGRHGGGNSRSHTQPQSLQNQNQNQGPKLHFVAAGPLNLMRSNEPRPALPLTSVPTKIDFVSLSTRGDFDRFRSSVASFCQFFDFAGLRTWFVIVPDDDVEFFRSQMPHCRASARAERTAAATETATVTSAAAQSKLKSASSVTTSSAQSKTSHAKYAATKADAPAFGKVNEHRLDSRSLFNANNGKSNTASTAAMDAGWPRRGGGEAVVQTSHRRDGATETQIMFNVVAESEIITEFHPDISRQRRKVRGYLKQMLLKLAAATLVDGFYLVLDTDVYAHEPFSVRDLFHEETISDVYGSSGSGSSSRKFGRVVVRAKIDLEHPRFPNPPRWFYYSAKALHLEKMRRDTRNMCKDGASRRKPFTPMFDVVRAGRERARAIDINRPFALYNVTDQPVQYLRSTLPGEYQATGDGDDASEASALTPSGLSSAIPTGASGAAGGPDSDANVNTKDNVGSGASTGANQGAVEGAGAGAGKGGLSGRPLKPATDAGKRPRVQSQLVSVPFAPSSTIITGACYGDRDMNIGFTPMILHSAVITQHLIPTLEHLYGTEREPIKWTDALVNWHFREVVDIWYLYIIRMFGFPDKEISWTEYGLYFYSAVASGLFDDIYAIGDRFVQKASNHGEEEREDAEAEEEDSDESALRHEGGILEYSKSIMNYDDYDNMVWGSIFRPIPKEPMRPFVLVHSWMGKPIEEINGKLAPYVPQIRLLIEEDSS